MQNQGVGSAKALFRKLSDEERQYPERYFISRQGLLGVGDNFRKEGRQLQAQAIREMAEYRYGQR